MTSIDKLSERDHNDMSMALVSRQTNGRRLIQQNVNSQNSHGQIIPYHSQVIDRRFPGHLAPPSEAPTENTAHNNSPKAHQNAKAIVEYNKNNVGKVREGKHAAAVEQIHQNDLHNIERVSERPQTKDKYLAAVNGMVIIPQDKTISKMAKDQLETPEHMLTPKSQTTYSQDSDLITSFDPMRDRHTWTMWRTAVNGRIVDEVRRLERMKIDKGPITADTNNPGMYGTALVATPLKQFIKLESDESKAIAAEMSSIGQWKLNVPQFVYFGIPRVRMSQPKK